MSKAATKKNQAKESETASDDVVVSSIASSRPKRACNTKAPTETDSHAVTTSRSKRPKTEKKETTAVDASASTEISVTTAGEEEAAVDETTKDTKLPKEKKSSSKTTVLAVGDALPDFTVTDQDKNTVSLHDIVNETGIVIYAYPKANTGGCTRQSLKFTELYPEFEKSDYRVYGISADSPTSQASWKKKHSFPFSLLSDTSSDRHVLASLGFLKPGSAAGKTSILRSHVVVEKGAKGGKVKQVVYGVKPEKSAELALGCLSKS